MRINARWLNGKPSNDLAEGGVVMWVFDGDGKYLDGLPEPDAPWAPNLGSPTGDRHSASMVSKRHPYLFACFACSPDSQFKPGLILAPSPETRSRLMCSVHNDLGTIRYKCDPMGRSDSCSPGCGNVRCGNPPQRTWMCTWSLEDLQRMMELHDAIGMGYTGPFEEGMWPYNELLFDSWTQNWEPDLAQLVEGVFVQKIGTQASKDLGRLVHYKLLQRIGASVEDHPLVEYDDSAEGDPFSLLQYRCAGPPGGSLSCEWL